MALFSEGHDAWLHPPLFRALGTAWVELVGWRPGGSALLLRAPTVVVSALAAAFALAAGHRLARGAATYRIAHVALLVAPPFVGATVLARPYSLVALLTAVSLWSIASRRGALAVAAAGLALWADPIGGALLALFVIAHLLTDGPRHRVAVALLALSLFAAPLIEGVAEAAAHPVLDAHYDAAVAAGQRASSGMGDAGPFSLFGRVLAFAGTGLDLAWLGLPAAVGLAAILARRRRPELGVALAIALGIACAIGLARSVRPRNLVVLPIGFAVVASAAAAKREDHPERHPERQEQR
ncbi:MAG: hypothetical protein KC619_12450, partial [Myxococcales bacterium]|nr:hypothetical protein [Myxococcales bacterium]